VDLGLKDEARNDPPLSLMGAPNVEKLGDRLNPQFDPNTIDIEVSNYGNCRPDHN
jgi:hypothetical protein